MRSNYFLILTLFFTAFYFSACGDAPDVEGSEFVIRNDILDKEYNSFVVDQVTTDHGLSGYSVNLKPNQKAKIPLRNITSLRFSRKYREHTAVYVVSCPPDMNKRVLIKLIDVHTNNIQGGECVTSRYGVSRGGFIEWDEK